MNGWYSIANASWRNSNLLQQLRRRLVTELAIVAKPTNKFLAQHCTDVLERSAWTAHGYLAMKLHQRLQRAVGNHSRVDLLLILLDLVETAL